VYGSAAFSTLPYAAAKLYIDLRVQLNGFNNGRLDATMTTMSKRGWTSLETLWRAIEELMARGLMARTREGKPGPAKICNLYRFTDLPTPSDEARFNKGMPATLEFHSWQPGKSFAPAKIGKKLMQINRATETVSRLIRKSNSSRYGNRTVEPIADTKTVAGKKTESLAKLRPCSIRREPLTNMPLLRKSYISIDSQGLRLSKAPLLPLSRGAVDLESSGRSSGAPAQTFSNPRES